MLKVTKINKVIFRNAELEFRNVFFLVTVIFWKKKPPQQNIRLMIMVMIMFIKCMH